MRCRVMGMLMLTMLSSGALSLAGAGLIAVNSITLYTQQVVSLA